MNPLLQRLVDASRLTRQGHLRAATDAIREALSGTATGHTAPGARPPIPAQPAQNAVIDVEAREVPAPSDARHPDPASDAPIPATAPTSPASSDVGAADPSSPAPAAAPLAPEMPSPRPFPDGRFIAGHYASEAGERDYKLYIPPAAGERALPLVVMLHGCTQDPDDFATGTQMNELARTQQFFVLYPRQSMRANPQRCWNWFKHNHQQRGRGEPALLAGMTREVMQRNLIDPARVYVAGLSAGGAMAAILGDAYPDLFAAVGVHSGIATGAANDLSSALEAMKRASGMAPATASGVPTIAFHGDADTVVHPGNARHVITASAHPDADVEVQQGLAPGGRQYTRELHHAPGGGAVIAEHWTVHGSPHAWSGGNAKGSFTDPAGPKASEEMVRFFLAHTRAAQG